MPKSLNIAFIASECVPYAKSGGLADVVGSLPGALKKLGHNPIIVIPLYRSIDRNKFNIQPVLSPMGVWMGDSERAGSTKWFMSQIRIGLKSEFQDGDQTVGRFGGVGDRAERYALTLSSNLKWTTKDSWSVDISEV